MKKIRTALTALIISASTLVSAQERSEFELALEAHHQKFTELMERNNANVPPLNIEAMKLERMAKENPALAAELNPRIDSLRHKADSLSSIFDKEYEILCQQGLEMERKFMFIDPLAFESAAYLARKRISKDSLGVLLSKASETVRKSEIGKRTREFIRNDQLQPSDKFKPIRCFDVNMNKFDWNSVKGKKFTIIVGGLWCMTHGMDNSLPKQYFESIKEKYGDSHQLILYVYCNGPEEMKAEIKEFGLEGYTVISDFKGRATPFTSIYNCQATPTCIYTDAEGIIVNIMEGLDTDYLENEFILKQ